MIIRYHVNAKCTKGGLVVREKGLGSFFYSSEYRQNLIEIAENIAKTHPYTKIAIKPRGAHTIPEVYLSTHNGKDIRDMLHSGYSTEQYLTKVGLKKQA
ncbi:MAG: hypothetical protein WCI72_06760 [archaeon]